MIIRLHCYYLIRYEGICLVYIKGVLAQRIESKHQFRLEKPIKALMVGTKFNILRILRLTCVCVGTAHAHCQSSRLNRACQGRSVDELSITRTEFLPCPVVLAVIRTFLTVSGKFDNGPHQ